MARHRLLTRAPSGLRRYKKAGLGAALLAFFALVAILRPVLGPYLSLESEQASVRYVIDGDTVILSDERHVRYIGIDTPEMDASDPRSRALARRAHELNETLVEGKAVRLEFDVEKKDRYGRTLAYVWAGGDFETLVNAAIVEEGLARAVVYGENRRYADELAALEAQAKAAGRGMWGEDR